MKTIEVKAVVDIPPLIAHGILSPEGRLLVDIEDVRAHLTIAAEAFDAAHAHSDIGKAVRAVRDGLTGLRTEAA